MVCEPHQKPLTQTELKVNGQDIELNSFVQDCIGKAVIGMIGSLRGVDEVQTVTVNISKPAE